MNRLSISLLGPFQVRLAGQPVSDFASDKVRALLAYLAVEVEREHWRQTLAGLLWPDFPERAARTNLRNALANLRRAIGDRQASPPFLQITRQTIQVNRASDYWLDVTTFTTLLATDEASRPAIASLEEGVALYQGPFLEGFALADSVPFEEWLLLKREALSRQLLAALHRLADTYEGRGAYGQALGHARRQVALDPYREEGQQQVMRLLALSGRRSEALAQYETCRQVLADELGVGPSAETVALYERIRAGELSRGAGEQRRRGELAAVPVAPAPFLSATSPQPSPPAFFVAREDELTQLDGFLDLALAGQGRVVFVTGEAGSGKTALVQEFARRAQEQHADLVVAGGNCNAYTGAGDPYLPFRETLGLLTGDIEAKWAAGTISQRQAQRLWNALPIVGQALVESGPGLIDSLVSGRALLARATTAAPQGAAWLDRLQGVIAQNQERTSQVQQRYFFQQYADVLQRLARHQPLLLVLEDLHWADSASNDLLFHLGRAIGESRTLIVGTYRPEEVALGRGGKRHPLEWVTNELKQRWGDIWVRLEGADEVQGRHFVEALLDSQPNQLPPDFREAFFRHARGHALFTVELLRAMQARGDLVRDRQGRWVPGPTLAWGRLPARVEGVIAERIGRLDEGLQEALTIASVEGEEFTAEVVARVLGLSERQVVRWLTQDLDRKHRLVQEQAVLSRGQLQVSRYRFRHYLFQTYLYNNLGQAERKFLHRHVGEVLETLYEDQTDDIALQAARHFEVGGLPEKAIDYLHQAGRQAVGMAANEEAITHLERGLALLVRLPDSRERAERELALQLILGVPLAASKGYANQAVQEVYSRAQALCRRLGQAPDMPILRALASVFIVRAELQKAHEFLLELLSQAQGSQVPEHLLEAHYGFGSVFWWMGKLVPAQQHLEQAITLYDPERHRVHLAQYAQDPGVICRIWLAMVLWFLGYSDQAVRCGRESLALARKLDHPHSFAYALAIYSRLQQCLHKPHETLKYAEQAIAVATEYEFAFWASIGKAFRGWALAELGQLEAGLGQILEGISAYLRTGAAINWPWLLGLAASAYGQLDQPEAGLAALDKALTLVADTGERVYEAELFRLKGELRLSQGAQEHAAEACFLQAIEVARLQGAKSLELRAVTSLSRLWQGQRKKEEARQMLAEIYDWFGEGFDTADLKEAQALLERLA